MKQSKKHDDNCTGLSSIIHETKPYIIDDIGNYHVECSCGWMVKRSTEYSLGIAVGMHLILEKLNIKLPENKIL